MPKVINAKCKAEVPLLVAITCLHLIKEEIFFSNILVSEPAVETFFFKIHFFKSLISWLSNEGSCKFKFSFFLKKYENENFFKFFFEIF